MPKFPFRQQAPVLWFATGYRHWYAWKESLLGVRASWAWRTGRAVKRLMRRWFQWQRA